MNLECPRTLYLSKNFYTTAEIMKKFNVSESWIFVMSKKNKIPKTFNRGKTYWSKKHVDAYFFLEGSRCRHYRMVQCARSSGQISNEP